MASKKPRDRYHHGDLRAALLEVAVTVIAERGLHGLSLRECARRLGVSHAAPYRHFADKSALLVALAGEGFRRLAESGREAMAGVADPHDRLRAYGVAYVRFAFEHPQHHRVMFGAEFDHGAVPPEDELAGNDAFELLRATAAEATGLSGGEEMPATLAFWSLAHGLSMLLIDGRIPPEHIETPEAIEALAESVFAHLRA
ncbi:MAG: TetR/AcrR family transcriptional regulator [Sandaracinaceae bacterium]